MYLYQVKLSKGYSRLLVVASKEKIKEYLGKGYKVLYAHLLKVFK